MVCIITKDFYISIKEKERHLYFEKELNLLCAKYDGKLLGNNEKCEQYINKYTTTSKYDFIIKYSYSRKLKDSLSFKWLGGEATVVIYCIEKLNPQFVKDFFASVENYKNPVRIFIEENCNGITKKYSLSRRPSKKLSLEKYFFDDELDYHDANQAFIFPNSISNCKNILLLRIYNMSLGECRNVNNLRKLKLTAEESIEGDLILKKDKWAII